MTIDSRLGQRRLAVCALLALVFAVAAPRPAKACSVILFTAVLAPGPGELLPTDGVPIIVGGAAEALRVLDGDGTPIDVTFVEVGVSPYAVIYEVHREGAWPAGETYLVTHEGVPHPGAPPATFQVGTDPAPPGEPDAIATAWRLGLAGHRNSVSSCGGNLSGCLAGLGDGLWDIELRTGPGADAPVIWRTIQRAPAFGETLFGPDPVPEWCVHVRRRDLAGRRGPVAVDCLTDERTCIVDSPEELRDGACEDVCEPPDPTPPIPPDPIDAGPAPSPMDAGPPPGTDASPERVRYGCDCSVGAAPLPSLAAFLAFLAIVIARRRPPPRGC